MAAKIQDGGQKSITTSRKLTFAYTVWNLAIIQLKNLEI